jgi:hypothetical protein
VCKADFSSWHNSIDNLQTGSPWLVIIFTHFSVTLLLAWHRALVPSDKRRIANKGKAHIRTCCKPINQKQVGLSYLRHKFTLIHSHSDTLAISQSNRTSFACASVLRGGGDGDYSPPAVTTPEVIQTDKSSKTIHVEISFPESAKLKCALCLRSDITRAYSNTPSCPNGAKDSLKKHFMATHQFSSVQFSYKCVLCNLSKRPTGSCLVKWSKSHLAECHPSYKIGKVTTKSGIQCEKCNGTFPTVRALATHKSYCLRSTKTAADTNRRLSLAFYPGKKVASDAQPVSKSTILPKAVSDSTPTKDEIELLEGKKQTRSTTKALSAMKDKLLQSSEKKQVAHKHLPSRRLTLIAENSPKSRASPARNLFTPVLPRSSKKRSLTPITSNQISILLNKALNKPRTIEARCLTFNNGVESWITGDVIVEYMNRYITGDYTDFIDPMAWRSGETAIPNKHTVFIPICHNSHWVLVLLNTVTLVAIYYDSKHNPIPPEIYDKLSQLGYTAIEPAPTERGPYQKDGNNCGVHVCLVALALKNNAELNYTNQEVEDFRSNFLEEILLDPKVTIIDNSAVQSAPSLPDADDDPIFIAQISPNTSRYSPIVTSTPMQSSISFHSSIFDAQSAFDSTQSLTFHSQSAQTLPVKPTFAEMSTQTDDLPLTDSPSQAVKPSVASQSVCISTQTALSAVEATLYKNSHTSKPKVDKPIPVDDRSKLPKLMQLKTKPSKEAKAVKLTDDTDSIKVKIISWLTAQIESYKADGSMFCRLEWIMRQYAFLLTNFAGGNIQVVNNVLTRVAPPDSEPGEIAIQTERNRQKKPQSQNDHFGVDIKQLYKKNRERAFKLIMGESAVKCTIPVEKVEEHFKNSSRKPILHSSDLDDVSEKVPPALIPGSFYDAFTLSEVKEILKKAKDTAPGSDRVRYRYISDLDSNLSFILFLCNECKKHKRIPSDWKSAETTLIHKSGDVDDITNWRPISLMSCLYKVYSSLWNNRLKLVRNLISKVQRGFSNREGCAENIALMRGAIDNTRSEKRDLAIAFLDLTNAFGSVPHELIQHSLRKFGFQDEFLDIVSDIYQGSNMAVLTQTDQTAPIQLHAGTKQGDPISPTLFNIAMEYLIRFHLERSRGVRIINTSMKMMAFADDLAIFAKSANQLQLELDKLVETATKLNLIFNPKKCAVLILQNGNPCVAHPITISGKRLTSLGENDTYKYLGVKIGNNGRCDIDDLLVQLTTEIRKVADSKLATWQKLDAIKVFIMSKLTYIGMNSTPELQSLTKFESIVMAAIKEIHSIPNMGGPREYVQLYPKNGGLGVLSPKTQILLNCLTATVRRLWSSSKFISNFQWDYLLAVASRFKKSEVTSKEEALEILNFDHVGTRSGSKFNVFGRIRHTVYSLSQTKDAPFHSFKFAIENDNLVIKLQVTADSKLYTIDSTKYKTVQTIIKNCLQKSMLNSLTAKRKVGRVTEVVASDPRNNRFVKDGGMLSYGCHSFIHKARTDTTLLLASGAIKAGENNYCRRCSEGVPETITHVLNHCKKHLSNLITDRHNSVLQRVVQGIRLGKKKSCKLFIDQKVASHSSQRPDIMLVDEAAKEVVISDVACPMENGMDAMVKASQRKIDKYTEIAKTYEHKGYTVQQLPVIVGSLGSWYKPNDAAISALGIDQKHSKTMIEIIQASVIEHSKNIYYKHLYGDQYKILPRRLPCLPFRGAKWTKVDFSIIEDDTPLLTSDDVIVQ